MGTDSEIFEKASGLAAFLLSAATLSRAAARGDIESGEVKRIVSIARDFSRLASFPGDPAVVAYAERLLTLVEEQIGRGSPRTPSPAGPH